MIWLFLRDLYHRKGEICFENYVQKLDPPGVAARNLQECLLLQIEKK
jgi:RNA polymerase sigma-54 factor